MEEIATLQDIHLVPSLPARGDEEPWETAEKQRLNALMSMGFSFLAVQSALQELGTESLEDVVDFLSNEMHAWQHPFLRNTYSARERDAAWSCMLCGEGMETHWEAVMDSSLRSQASIGRLTVSFPAMQQVSRMPCPICAEGIYSAWKSAECQEHTFCSVCAVDYVISKVEEGKTITCPFQNCPAVLKVEEIRELVGTEITKLWEKKRLERNPMYHHCPKINCSGYLLGVAQMRKAICPVCRLGLCSHCGKKWHSRRTCNEVARTEMQDSIAVKACPRCARFIEKNQGCDHMTCQMCMHEWCWQCLQPYTATHFTQNSAYYCSVLQRNSRPVLSPRLFERRYPRKIGVSVKVILVCCSPLWLALLLAVYAILTAGAYAAWIYICFRLARLIVKERKSPVCIGVYAFLLLCWPIAPLGVGVFAIFFGFKEKGHRLQEMLCRLG